MNILWLAPFPYLNNKNMHPAPWIDVLSSKISKINGIKLTILNTYSRLDKNIEIIKMGNIRYIYIKVPAFIKDISSLYKIRIKVLYKYLKEHMNEYDLIHIHGSEHQFEVAALNINIPKIISIQGIMTKYHKVLPISFLKRKLACMLSALYEKKTLPKYNNFFCRTKWDTSFVKGLNPEANIYKTWEMIRSQFFNDNNDRDSTNILFMGGDNPIKGLKEALIALNILWSKNYRFNLTVIGKCKLEKIDYMIRRNNLTMLNRDFIECRGVQDAVSIIKVYNKSFCLLHPTYIDNSPNSVCEAQCSGLPVIASNVGGVSSLIKDGYTGLLTNLNPNIIADKIIKLHKDKKLWDNINKLSKNVAHDRHNAETILRQTLDAYRNIVQPVG